MVDSTIDAVDATPGDGTCGTVDGLCTLRAAIEEANALPGPDSIALPSGKCKLALGELAITQDLTITGAGVDTSVVDGKRKSRVFNIANSTAVTISQVQIRGGVAEFGAGILNDGTLQLSNASLVSNRATRDGGGSGGGIYNYGTLQVTDVSFVRNRATGFGGGFGGGLYNDTGTAQLTNVTLERNYTPGCGGGLFNNTGTLQLTNGTLRFNRGVVAGGGVFNQAGPVTLTNALVYRNRTSQIGGGVFTYGTLTLTNVTLDGNRGFDGGGLFSRITTDVDLSNVTITGNSAANGGGLLNNGIIRMKNTIVASNRPQNCMGDAVTSLGHNLDGGATCGFTAGGDLSSADPKLDPLADNGGFSKTHALLPGSPAIDAGDNAGCALTDQRGAPSPADGDGDGGPVCDIGAYELQP